MEQNYMQQLEQGVFANFKTLRDTLYKPETPTKLKYSGADFLFEKHNHIWIAENSNAFIEVANNKCEILGAIYYWKKWKELVWEQYPNTIMSIDCLREIEEVMKQKAPKSTQADSTESVS